MDCRSTLGGLDWVAASVWSWDINILKFSATSYLCASCSTFNEINIGKVSHCSGTMLLRMFWGSMSMSSSLSSLSSHTSAMTLRITNYGLHVVPPWLTMTLDHGSSCYHDVITWGHPPLSPPQVMDGVTAQTRESLPDVTLGDWSLIKHLTQLTHFKVNCSTPLWMRWPVWGRVRWWGPSSAA